MEDDYVYLLGSRDTSVFSFPVPVGNTQRQFTPFINISLLKLVKFSYLTTHVLVLCLFFPVKSTKLKNPSLNHKKGFFPSNFKQTSVQCALDSNRAPKWETFPLKLPDNALALGGGKTQTGTGRRPASSWMEGDPRVGQMNLYYLDLNQFFQDRTPWFYHFFVIKLTLDVQALSHQINTRAETVDKQQWNCWSDWGCYLVSLKLPTVNIFSPNTFKWPP